MTGRSRLSSRYVSRGLGAMRAWTFIVFANLNISLPAVAMRMAGHPKRTKRNGTDTQISMTTRDGIERDTAIRDLNSVVSATTSSFTLH